MKLVRNTGPTRRAVGHSRVGRPRNVEGKVERIGTNPDRFRIRWYDDTGKRRTVTAATEDRVRQKWLVGRERTSQRARPGYDPRAVRLVRGWLEWWVNEGRPGWRGSSRRRHRYYVNSYVLLPKLWLGVRTDALTIEHVEEAISKAHRRDGTALSGAAKQHLLASLRVAMNDAIRRNLATTNPCARFELGEDTRSQARQIIQPEDTPAFLDLCLARDEGGPPKNADALALLLLTGMRGGELRSLVWGDWLGWQHVVNQRDGPSGDPEAEVDAVHKLWIRTTLSACQADYKPRRDRNEAKITPCIVRGNPKTDKGVRQIPLSDHAVGILRNRFMKEFRKSGRPPDDRSPIFVAPAGGFLSAHALPEALALVRTREAEFNKRSGRTYVITPPRVHDLRHSAASRWIAQGRSLTVCAAMLGHADGGRLLQELYGQKTNIEMAEVAAGDDALIGDLNADRFAKTAIAAQRAARTRAPLRR